MRQGSTCSVEIAGDGELAAVERGVAEAVDALVGLDLERDEVAVRRADDQACGGNLHKLDILRIDRAAIAA